MRIKTNLPALNAQASMSKHIRDMENSSGKLASGKRVRSAADDPASLAIGIHHQAQIRSQAQAIRNANDAVSDLQINEGALNEISAMLVRLKELSVNASSSHLQDSDREMINLEYLQLRKEIERTIKTTSGLGPSLLRSQQDTKEFQIGTEGGQLSRLSINTDELLLSEFNMRIVDSSLINAEEAQLNLGYINEAMEKVSSNRALLGSYQNRLHSAINNLDTTKVNESAALSRRMDVDYAHEISEKLQIEGKLKSNSSVLAQTSRLGENALKLL